MLQEAFERTSFLKPEDIYVATNEKYVGFVREQIPEVPEENILTEPALRDTATCIGFAAAMIGKDHPEEVMAVIYADHMVQDQDEFARKLLAAEKVALKDHTLNIVEVEAKEPNVNLGYVEVGDEIEQVEGESVLAFKKFKEKPDLETAAQYQEAGNYLWNTGYYVWRIKDILDKYRQHLPDTYERLMKMQQDPSCIETEYPQCEKISIDYAIMEKCAPEEVRILPSILGWSDIGTWETLFKELSKGENVTKGENQAFESEGNLIYNYSNKRVHTIGINGMAIVVTGDDILICPLDKSQNVKKLQK